MNFESDPDMSPLQFKGEIMDFDLNIDHRKRRRNRTTQSCLNCHTSKRKCDRKRPCSRCIQLGLTGLCVYEVDDPALRDDPNIDETTRLRNRIAELESLVRELRGKPHPKWAEPNYCDGDATEKWHSRSSKRIQPQYQKSRRESDDGSLQLPSVVKTEQTAELSQQQLYRLSTTSGVPAVTHDIASASYHRHHLHSATHQSFSSPVDESIAYYSSSSSSSPLDYGDHRYADNFPHANNGQFSQAYVRPSSNAAGDLQPSCSCLTNPLAGHPLIALTNQLRNTLQQLRQLPEHQGQHDCLVLSQILELDDTMHGADCGYYSSDARYDVLPPPTETELMSPASSSGRSSMGNPISEWQPMANGGYDHYFQAATSEHAAYQKQYHVV